MEKYNKIIYNQKYIIKYDFKFIDIYEINSKLEKKSVLNFKSEDIIDIQFNPVLNNVFLVSFYKGYCKIYEIIKTNIQEKILFEGINREVINISKFNYLNTNIIASLCNHKAIVIWDVRKRKYINIITNKEKEEKEKEIEEKEKEIEEKEKEEDEVEEKEEVEEEVEIKEEKEEEEEVEIEEEKEEEEEVKDKEIEEDKKKNQEKKDKEKEIFDFKWNRTIRDSLEIKTAKYIKLIDINNDKVIRSLKIEPDIQNVFFLEDYNIIIKKDKIITSKNENIILNCLNVKGIRYSTDSLINDNFLIIFLISEIKFIKLQSMEIIESIEFEEAYNFELYNNDKEDEIDLYYRDFYAELKKKNIKFKNKISKINKFSDKDNIKNNFYDEYQKKINKYISLLDFKENLIDEKVNNKKKYMEIKEVMDYFEKIKKIDIFSRKEFINYIFDGSKKDESFNNILEVNNFKVIIDNFKSIEKEKNTKQRKNYIIRLMKKIFDDKNENIKILYIEIIKLLILDNSNKNLIEIYLIFLYLYKKKLIKIFSKGKIEEYDSEVKYYRPCFSKKDYKILFNLNKNSERFLVLNFLNKAYAIKDYLYNNSDLVNLVKKARKIIKNTPDFNQPIELDNPNEELKWHKIKISILAAFNNFELNNENQDKIGRLKKGILTVIDKNKNLLKNEDIIHDKDKLECTLILITNPCNNYSQDSQFITNLLLSKELKKEELKKYKNIKDAENLCSDNMSEIYEYDSYELRERYNFKYLMENYVSNQNKIKEFLKKILVKNVFKEAYRILFGNDDYKLLNKKYLTELIDNRLKFAPIRPYGSCALTDKMTLNTYISAIKRKIENVQNSQEIKLILNTGCYVLIEEHEIFHLLDCLPHYENNCLLSIKTPRKKNFDGEVEGGFYLEYLLFNKTLEEINLGEILYILNERNYDKSLIEFREGFEKIEEKDLRIEGVFSEFNNCKDLMNIKPSEMNNIYIKAKRTIDKKPFNINIKLRNDVIGNKPYNY